MKRLIPKYRLHLLFWGLYFIFWTIVSANVYHNSYWQAFLLTSIWFAGQAGASYLCLYWLIPRYLNTKRYVVFSLLVMATLLVGSAFVTGGLMGILWIRHIKMTVSPLNEFLYNVMGNFYMCLLVVALKSLKDKMQTDRRHALLEKEKTENELRFLKSQMNPHFLFNALNSIYVLIRKDPDLAEHTLAGFSDMLRYQLYECASDLISVDKEVAYLENYIRLEQLRKGESLCVAYDKQEGFGRFTIAPLLIFPLIENAFKYVSSYPDRENRIAVRLSYTEPMFRLDVSNTTEPEGGAAAHKGGLGLETLRRRLTLLYPNRHQLDIQQEKETYSATLQVQVL